MSETEAEAIPPADPADPAVPDDAAGLDHEDAQDAQDDQYDPDEAEDIGGADVEADGIPDEPAAFAEELRAAGDVPETGDTRVDEVLGGLAGIEGLPPAEHVAVYDSVHKGLQDALANLDQG